MIVCHELDDGREVRAEVRVDRWPEHGWSEPAGCETELLRVEIDGEKLHRANWTLAGIDPEIIDRLEQLALEADVDADYDGPDTTEEAQGLR